MIPVESQDNAQSKSSITQLDCPGVMPPSPNEDVSSRVPEISLPCVNLAQAASMELPLNVEQALITEETNRTSQAILDQEILEEFAFAFPDPASTLTIQGSANSDQDWYGVSNLILAGDAMGQNPQTQFLMFSCPFEYELEKLRREEWNSRKNFEEKTSELKAELEKKMAEIRSEYDGKIQELDAEYNAIAMESKSNMNLVEMNSLLANAFVRKCTDPTAATVLPAVKARSPQHSSQQRQAVQTNTHMNSTAPPRLSVTAAEAPILNPSGPLLYFLCCTTTQQRPISQEAVVQSNTHTHSTALPRPLVTAEALPLHSPSNHTPQPRPLPLITNLNPSSSPPVYGIVRSPAPHLQAFRASRTPNTSAAASTTYPRRLAQEQQQQKGNSNGEVVCLSDDEE